MRIPPGPLTREQRRAILASIFGHKFGGPTIEQHEQHLEENRLARWYGYQNDEIATARDTFRDSE